MVFWDDMNQTQEIERLQNALANLATVMAKIIRNRVDQTLAEILPVKLPAPDDKAGSDRILTKKQLAEVFQVSQRTVDSWMKRGYLPYWKIGWNIRFRLGDVLQTLDLNTRHLGTRRWK